MQGKIAPMKVVFSEKQDTICIHFLHQTMTIKPASFFFGFIAGLGLAVPEITRQYGDIMAKKRAEYLSMMEAQDGDDRKEELLEEAEAIIKNSGKQEA